MHSRFKQCSYILALLYYRRGIVIDVKDLVIEKDT